MAQPIGFQTCIPQAKFAFPRSYVWGVQIQSGAALAVWTDNHMDLIDTMTSYVYWSLTFDPRFWGWSSNRWTLDFVLTEAYYTVPPSPTHLDLPVTVSWRTDWIQNVFPVINVAAFGTGGTFQFKQLAHQPSSYWLPAFY